MIGIEKEKRTLSQWNLRKKLAKSGIRINSPLFPSKSWLRYRPSANKIVGSIPGLVNLTIINGCLVDTKFKNIEFNWQTCTYTDKHKIHLIIIETSDNFLMWTLQITNYSTPP